MNHQKSQHQLLKQKGLGTVDNETIKYLRHPIGKSIALSLGKPSMKPKKKCHWSDRIKCKICGKTYVRSACTKHKSTEYHKLYERFDEKIRNIMLAEDNGDSRKDGN